ncbi:MAG: c-type cytochrome, partial [Geminicoccaceae bacterium]
MSTDPCRRLSRFWQGSARPRPARLAALAIGLGLLAGVVLAQGQAGPPERDAGGNIVFRHALDNQPIEFTYRSEQAITPAVEQFHKTAANAYSRDPDAIAAGKATYAKLCQACHLPDGAGRIGPSLVDGKGARARTGSELGRFEIIYAGGAGAMQAFGRRLDQDQILQVMAYLEVLREAAD